ncbi:MAG: hypothetical protein WBA74_10795 [Cyclobacteriaceae bacterium]
MKVRICYSSLLEDHRVLEEGSHQKIEEPGKINMKNEFAGNSQ